MKKIINLFLISILLVHCSDDNNTPETLKYNLTTEAKPAEGGSIFPASGNYSKGSEISIKVTPANGYTFKKWSGELSGDGNPSTLIMNSDKKVVAEFEINVPTYTNGEGIIGPYGGTVTIEDSSSPINGATIVIPEGALSKNENIKISLAPTNIKFLYNENIPIVKLEPEGLEFLKPVEITLPFNYTGAFRAPSYIEIINYNIDTEKITVFETIKEDLNKVTITALIEHFSYYLVWDKNVRLSVDMLKSSDKIGVNLFIHGFDRYIGSGGFKEIRTTLLHMQNGHFNAWTCLTDPLHNNVFSMFRISLFEYKLSGSIGVAHMGFNIKRINNGGSNYSAEIYNAENASLIYTTNILSNDDFYNYNVNALTTWFSGMPLIFIFDDYNPEEGKKYFVKVEWALGSNLIGSPITNYTPIFEFNTKKNRLLFEEMKDIENDYNNNYIDDNLESLKPEVKIESITSVSPTSVRIKCSIKNFGNSIISTARLYYGLDNSIENSEYINLYNNNSETDYDRVLFNLASDTDYFFTLFAQNSNGQQSVTETVKFHTENSPPIYLDEIYPENLSEISSESVELKWKYSDPENDPLTYDVYFGATNTPEKVSTKQSKVTYDLAGLKKGVKYYWYIIAHDDHGNSTKSDLWSFSVVVDKNIYTYIPDDNFEQALINLGYDDEMDDYVITKNIENIEILDISYKNIKFLDGIEGFLNLIDLKCNNNVIISDIDLSNSPNLKYLDIATNQISNINLSNNPALKGVALNWNKITSVNILRNTNLVVFRVRSNQLTSLDISLNTLLDYFDAELNPSLNCINVSTWQIDHRIMSENWDKDSNTNYSTNCSGGNGGSSDIVFNPNLTYGNISDNDGNTYKTIVIGTQTWMAENLKTTKYQNGDDIPNVTNGSQWEDLVTGAYSNFGNDINNVSTYGRLYNWYSVNDSRNICPQGWHIPDEEEWKTLANSLGGWYNAGGNLKEIDYTHWNTPNKDASNSSGFTALPGGYRYGLTGTFLSKGVNGYLWSNTESGSTGAYAIEPRYDEGSAITVSHYKSTGFCVRCVKN